MHNAASLDGWLDGFEVDLGLYYEIAGRLQADAILAGSETILAAFGAVSGEEGPTEAGGPGAPLLVVVDGRGRIAVWERIRHQPYWRGVIALGSRATPAASLEAQRRSNVESIVCGEAHVDLASALDTLAARHAVRRVRVDSGGRLNRALLRAGLVDEVSLLLHPVLAGAAGTVRLVAAESSDAAVPLALAEISCEQQRGGVIWVRGRLDGGASR